RLLPEPAARMPVALDRCRPAPARAARQAPKAAETCLGQNIWPTSQTGREKAPGNRPAGHRAPARECKLAPLPMWPILLQRLGRDQRLTEARARGDPARRLPPIRAAIRERRRNGARLLSSRLARPLADPRAESIG